MKRAVGLGVVLLLAAQAHANPHLLPNPHGPLAGKTVVLSPGHGYLLDGSSWRYQRGVLHELREDIHTNEIVTEYLQRFLLNAGATVEVVRERSFQTNEAIVDDQSAGYSESGPWTSSTSNPNFYGSRYRYGTAASGATEASFSATLAAGRYPVYLWWTAGGNRGTDVPVTIHHAGGQTLVHVDQTQLGDHWRFVGEFYFDGPAKVSVGTATSDPNAIVVADAVRFGGGIGPSGQPRWRESAQTFLAHKGFSSTRSDVTIRPAYAVYFAGGDTTRWSDDHLYFALHTNAGGGSGLSTFSYSNGRTPSWGSAGARHYPTSPSPLENVSDALRAAIHQEVIDTVHAEFDPSWADRGVHRMNFGELRECLNMPSTLIELGFHDSAADAALLSNPAFRSASARAIYKGILRHWRGANAQVLPLAPEGLRLHNLGAGQLEVTWDVVDDPREPTARPTSWVVYTSRDGRAFDDGTVVSQPRAVLQGLQDGDLVWVRVSALNGGGESLLSRTGGARIGEGPGALIVDAFDRLYDHTEVNIQGRYTYDYAVEHLTALDAAGFARPVDYVENEAVDAGQVRLEDYALVDWLLGRESSLDRTFTPAEQTSVDLYLAGGGTILVSGTEVGWDLEARGGGVQFFNDVLGARYVRDDAGTRSVLAQGPFSALAALSFDDGTRGSYDAAFPDVLAPSASGEQLLSYRANGVDGAGVGVPLRSVVLGFPVESVVSDTLRTDLVRESVLYLDPTLFQGTAQPTQPATAGAPGTTGGAATATAPAAAAAGSGGGGGGGCSMGGAPTGAPLPAALALLVLFGLRLRASREG